MDAPVPTVIRHEPDDDPLSLLAGEITARFVSGEYPHARVRSSDRLRKGFPLVPEGVTAVRTVDSDGSTAYLSSGDGYWVHAVRWSNGNGRVRVVAKSGEQAESVLAGIIAAAEEPADGGESGTVELGFWHVVKPVAHRMVRTIEVPSWAEIRRNYPSSSVGRLDALMAMTPEQVRGHLLLLHGPPGTGKTTALRALSHQWRSWCRTDCVLDPEVLFDDTGYLVQVALGDEFDDSERWQLLILEDCDELIRGEAKASAGQALSRLLNLTDGLLGQGRRLIIALTTNEDLVRLHPAVIRPGRCLAQIEIGPLPFTEAVDWLGNAEGIGPHGASLAELVALRSGEEIEAGVPLPTGHYL